MTRLRTILVLSVVAGGFAACSGGSATVLHTSHGTVVLSQGDGSTSTLADALKSANLGCSDYQDVPQVPQNLSAGIKDIGNCKIGHLGAFSSNSARDQWVSTQLNTVKMADCVEGTTWAVCLFPNQKVTKAKVQSALSGVTTS